MNPPHSGDVSRILPIFFINLNNNVFEETKSKLSVWNTMPLRIRSYRSDDEEDWLKCHVNAYIGSNERRFLKEKTRYTRPTIELVVVDDQRIVV